MTFYPSTPCEAAPACLKMDPHGYDLPTCRGCGAPTCERHRVPGSLKEGERDRSYGDYTVAEHWETVECLACFSEAMNARFEEKQRP